MRDISPQSPEARRKRLASMRAAFGTEVEEKLKPKLTPWEVVKRVAVGVYADGFIHAGNLAYLSILALFPFFILAAAIAHLLGQSQDAQLTVANVLRRLPPDVASTLQKPVQEVLTVRTGTLRPRRPVDGGELHRDDPRYSPPGVRGEVLRALLGISPRLDPYHPRRGASADDRLCGERRLELAPARATRMVSVRSGAGNDAWHLPPGPGGDLVLHFLRALLRADARALSQARLQEMARRSVGHRLVAGHGRGPAVGAWPPRRRCPRHVRPSRS